jgi:hypothetical protein
MIKGRWWTQAANRAAEARVSRTITWTLYKSGLACSADHSQGPRGIRERIKLPHRPSDPARPRNRWREAASQQFIARRIEVTPGHLAWPARVAPSNNFHRMARIPPGANPTPNRPFPI